MNKLVIMVEPLPDEALLDEIWPQFLHLSERMPGLRREATSRVDHVLYGRYKPVLIHELFFDSLSAIETAMTSPEGQAAGELLQQMTEGRMSLLVADHLEDDLDHIRQHRQAQS